MIEATQAEIDRFFQYVEKLPNGCWFWAGGRSRGRGNKKWYGSFRFRGRTIRAHRFANDVVAERGSPPKGYHRDHTCKFSLCVNPNHIEVVPSEINQERRWDGKRKTSLPYADPPKSLDTLREFMEQTGSELCR